MVLCHNLSRIVRSYKSAQNLVSISDGLHIHTVSVSEYHRVGLRPGASLKRTMSSLGFLA